MTKLLLRIAVWLRDKLDYYTRPDDMMLVLYLTMHTANLEMSRDERTFLAPTSGSVGPLSLTGTGLPTVYYKVFEKKIMEFIQVRVELCRPDKIRFFATIDSTTAPERHGEVVKIQSKYEKPFWVMAYNVYKYWPIYRESKIVRDLGI